MTEQRNPTYYEISNIKTNGLRPARFAQKEADREVREQTRGLAPDYNRKGKGRTHGHSRVRTAREDEEAAH